MLSRNQCKLALIARDAVQMGAERVSHVSGAESLLDVAQACEEWTKRAVPGARQLSERGERTALSFHTPSEPLQLWPLTQLLQDFFSL